MEIPNIGSNRRELGGQKDRSDPGRVNEHVYHSEGFTEYTRAAVRKGDKNLNIDHAGPGPRSKDLKNIQRGPYSSDNDSDESHETQDKFLFEDAMVKTKMSDMNLKVLKEESSEEKVHHNTEVPEEYKADSKAMEIKDSVKTVKVDGNSEVEKAYPSASNITKSVSEVPTRSQSPKTRRASSELKSIAKSKSTIDINISRMISGDTDSSDPVAKVTTKTVDFSTDEIEQELARVMIGNDDGLSTVSSDAYGRAAATNTPVESFLYSQSLLTPVRDNIYDHALHLIKNRCSSGTTGISSQSRSRFPSRLPEDNKVPHDSLVTLPTLIRKINEPPFSSQPNKAFFIAQHRPIPLEPLQVWKGYHGNVFFQPLLCQRMKIDQVGNSLAGQMHRKMAKHRKNSRFQQLSSRATTAKTWNEQDNLRNGDPRNTASAVFRPGTRQMSVLDRRTVMSQMDHHAGEDITWLNGMEALGALKTGIGRSRSSAHFYDNKEQHYKLRICRGLVSHKNAGSTNDGPTLDVCGGRMDEKNAVFSHKSNVLKEMPVLRTRYSAESINSSVGSLQKGNHVVVDLTNGRGRLKCRKQNKVL